MKLIFLRHGIAVDKKDNQSELDDAIRELTDDGIVETRKMVKSLKPLFKELDTIYSSPMVRAVETAQIVSKIFPKKNLELMSSLDSTVSTDVFSEDIRQLNPDGNYCFVGHEPHLSHSISKILKEHNATIALKKSGVVLLEGRNLDELKITFVLSPAMLQNIKS